MNNGSESNITSLTKDDIRKKIEKVDRNEAMKKLRSMGLGSVADKLKNISDDELIGIISKNPSLLKKINGFLK